MGGNKWTKEQLAAIETRNCNLLVAAAAGAGKTAVLVERIIRMITDEHNPLDIDRLLVVTFTNAAAAEMRERIAQAISKILEENPSSAKMQRQLTLLHKASITTIHSFCLEVIRSNFEKVEIDPAFRIADETEAELLKLEVLQELFEELYEVPESNEVFFELLECYGGNRDDQALQNMVLNLYDYIQSSPWPQKWLNTKTEYFNITSEQDLSETHWGQVLLCTARLELEGLQTMMEKAIEMIGCEPGLEGYFPLLADESERIAQLVQECQADSPNRWDNLYQGLQEFTFDRLPPAAKDCNPEIKDYVRETRDYVKKRLNDLSEKVITTDSAETWQDLQKLYPLMNTIASLVNELSRRYAVRKSERSILDFNDLEHFCLDILSETDEENTIRPSQTALQYRERFAEILVDEYQDSNEVQETIIQMISKTDQDEPNVFMVGDVKQSIYRFRQAKPVLFQNKYEHYSEQEGDLLRKILLSQNFRSRKEVIDAVNYVFTQIMSKTVGELDYTEKEALNCGASYDQPQDLLAEAGGEVEIHLLQTKGEEDAEEFSSELEQEDNKTTQVKAAEDPAMLDKIQCEARLAARRIKEMMFPPEEDKVYKVYDKEQRQYRNIQYRDIVILLRTTRDWANIFAEEFGIEGIPAFADTGTGFFKTVEIQVILSLLQVIDNPLQDIPLLAVLRSPLVSFTTDELAILRLADRRGLVFDALQALAQTAEQRKEDQDSTVQAAAQKAASFVSKLQHWRGMAVYMSADQLLWQLYQETGYYGVLGAMPAGKQRQANLRILFERARQFEETSYKGLFNFINFIDKLQSSQGDMGSAKILGENDNVVRIMSIHKSKGLEFPVVLLAGCGKKFNLMDMNKKILLHQDLGFGPDVVDYRKRIAYPSIPKLAIREKIRVESLSEEMRILYVALTRAREKLIMIGAVKDISKSLEKWSKCAEGEEKSLAPYQMLRGEKYLDWIGPAVLRHPASAELRKVLGLSSLSLEHQSVWRIQLWHKNDFLRIRTAEEQQEKEFLTWLENLAADHTGRTDQEIERRLSWEYPWAKLTQVPAKVTVTELKRRYEVNLAEAGEPNFLKPHIPTLVKKPMFMEGVKGLSAAEAGSNMHFVMQHLDLAEPDIEGQIQKMIAHNLLTQEQAESVDPEKIKAFLLSPLGHRMCQAPDVKREVRFNLEIPCQEVYSQLDEDICRREMLLLQGVIDCYFEEEDGIVLLDYKTDYVAEGGQQSIQEKYRTQISYYARALERLTGKSIKEKYIYLFHTGEALRY